MQPKPLFKGGISIKGVTFVLRPDSPLAKVVAAIRVNVQIAENYANGAELLTFAGVNADRPTKSKAKFRPEAGSNELESGHDAPTQDVHTP